MPRPPPDPAQKHLRKEVGPDVVDYKRYTLVIKDFVREHGLILDEDKNSWDLAPFHVLNKRNGEPVPPRILDALDAAIRRREEVNDRFTYHRFSQVPKLLYDGQDVSHRVFVEKLRTFRRVWFPSAPDDPAAASAKSGAGMPSSRARIGSPHISLPLASDNSPFATRSSSSEIPPYYEVAFSKIEPELLTLHPIYIV